MSRIKEKDQMNLFQEQVISIYDGFKWKHQLHIIRERPSSLEEYYDHDRYPKFSLRHVYFDESSTNQRLGLECSYFYQNQAKYKKPRICSVFGVSILEGSHKKNLYIYLFYAFRFICTDYI